MQAAAAAGAPGVLSQVQLPDCSNDPMQQAHHMIVLVEHMARSGRLSTHTRLQMQGSMLVKVKLLVAAVPADIDANNRLQQWLLQGYQQLQTAVAAGEVQRVKEVPAAMQASGADEDYDDAWWHAACSTVCCGSLVSLVGSKVTRWRPHTALLQALAGATMFCVLADFRV